MRTTTLTCLVIVTCTMVPPVAIMGSDTSTLSSAAKDAGSLFRYHDACAWAVIDHQDQCCMRSDSDRL